MPTYEYACKACDHNFEIVQSFSEDSLTTCPECEQDELRKVYNAAGIIFKGDGWHIKDYASSKSSTTAPSDSSGKDTAASDSSAGTASDTSSKDASSSSKPSKDSTSGSGSGSAAGTAARPAAS